MDYSFFGIPDEDLEVAINILYDEIALAWSVNRDIPNKIALAKMARSNYSIGLFEAMNLVREMEKKYEGDLKEMSYF